MHTYVSNRATAHLDGEFSGRCQYDHIGGRDPALAVHEPLKQREPKRSGLPRAGHCTPADVPPGQGNRDAGGLLTRAQATQ
eukprot:scaffold235979_cov17-Prasinocladus_malaysianus.AAC.1